jgi:hypothetical protein
MPANTAETPSRTATGPVTAVHLVGHGAPGHYVADERTTRTSGANVRHANLSGGWNKSPS